MAIQRRSTAGGEPRYEVRMRGPDGRERSRTFRTRKAAEGYEREQLSLRDQGGWVDPRASRMTLEEWVREWSGTIVHLRPSTRRIYDDNLRLHVLPTLGSVPLSKLTKTELRRWLAQLAATDLSPASVHQAFRCLRRVLGAAVDGDVLARNPLAGIKPPKVERRDMRFLTADETATLAETIDERYRAFVLVAAYCGLRWGELAGLRRHRVDLMHRSIQVVEALGIGEDGRPTLVPVKTGASHRAVTMPALVAEVLEHHLAHYAAPGRTGFVFTAPHGGRLDVNSFRNRYWLPAVETAGLAPLRVHDLRHTAASLAIAAGADVKVLQSMLGHASAAMTLDRYGHLMPGQTATVAERLDAMARAAVATVPPAPVPLLSPVPRTPVPLHARDFRGMDRH
jgi:integrase